ncbi:NUDIX domain-containing protein [Paractinoplanes atraurantiacus]|uniref:ADP-ribose pyrophosphatase YjhB, NUDIX family n=1 Tax=Paractinoplanes atraurantiacus TaxID=1036182 RepID=A0A285KL36_9ACTN|nr:ADP-ribose pyrophosphatase YjhB, NUDIX family [Actinoplanes atraurantiacus]
MATTFTHPDVLTVGVRDGWADPVTDPTRIDWAARQREAEIWFDVVDGRPVNPHAPTGIRYGRNELGHWGEGLAADAIVVAITDDGQRWLLMVERDDSRGWALPGGMVDPGEDRWATAERELAEETGLRLPERVIREHWLPRYVPDPRASDEAWIVTLPMYADLNAYGVTFFAGEAALPPVTGGDDARQARWLPAGSYAELSAAVHQHFSTVYPAHEQLLRDVLDGPGEAGMFLEIYVDDQLADYTPEQLRVAAANFLRLREVIRMTMADVSDWEDGDEQGCIAQLRAYLAHLSDADRGTCDLCGRVIFAPHPTAELPRHPWWHPRRWAHAFGACWTLLRYGGYRIAHRSCLPVHH